MSEVIHGACLCGRLAFDVHEPEAMAVCHRTRCQWWTGGAGSTVVITAAKKFKVTKGQDLMKKFHEDNFADRYVCGQCGSGIYADGGQKYYVSPGGLRDVKLKPAMHMKVAYKAPWDDIAGSAPQFPEWPPA